MFGYSPIRPRHSPRSPSWAAAWAAPEATRTARSGCPAASSTHRWRPGRRPVAAGPAGEAKSSAVSPPASRCSADTCHRRSVAWSWSGDSLAAGVGIVGGVVFGHFGFRFRRIFGAIGWLWLVCWLIPRGSVDCCESSGVRVEFCQARVGLFIGLEVWVRACVFKVCWGVFVWVWIWVITTISIQF